MRLLSRLFDQKKEKFWMYVAIHSGKNADCERSACFISNRMMKKSMTGGIFVSYICFEWTSRTGYIQYLHWCQEKHHQEKRKSLRVDRLSEREE